MLTPCLYTLSRLQVRTNRLMMFPFFETYDKIHNGAVTRTQFRRILNDIELAFLVPTETEWTCLWEKFQMVVGGRKDVSYVDFCNSLYPLAGFNPAIP